MKKISLVIFLFISSLSFSQSDDYKGFLSELYLYRQPSARADAMGTGLVASNDGDFGSHYNPALTSLNKGLTVNYSHSYRFYSATESSFNYFGAQYSAKAGSFGMSYYRWDHGKENSTYRVESLNISPYDNSSSYILSANYSREFIKDFFVGGNINYVRFFYGRSGIQTATEHNDKPGNTLTLDLGLLKKIQLNKPESKVQTTINLGASIINFTNSVITYYHDSPYTKALPQIFRIGASHNVKIKEGVAMKDEIFTAMTHFEYQKIFNNEYHESFKAGEELGFYNVAFIRLGYYSYKVPTTTPGGEPVSTSKFTFGVGVNIPMDKIFKMEKALSLKIDYVSLPQHNYWVENSGLDNFTTFALNLNYEL